LVANTMAVQFFRAVSKMERYFAGIDRDDKRLALDRGGYARAKRATLHDG
jgi:hypothetical protein